MHLQRRAHGAIGPARKWTTRIIIGLGRYIRFLIGRKMISKPFDNSRIFMGQINFFTRVLRQSEEKIRTVGYTSRNRIVTA